MIRRTERGVYADNLPTGEFVYGVLQGDTVTHLASHLGDIPVPAGETLPGPKVMFNRITNVGGFQILAKSHSRDITYHYQNGSWRELLTAAGVPAISHGVQGHIFLPTGEPLVWLPCQNCESQGYRYIDPVLGPVMGSPTYHPGTALSQSLGITALYGWTHIDGIVVGQGEHGGIVIQYRGALKLLDPAAGEMVQFKKQGTTLAVSWSVFKAREVGLVWLDESEILGLPDYVVATPAPPPPIIVPPPPSEPVFMSTPNHLIAIAVESGRTIDQRFPGLREQNVDAWMTKVAYLASKRDPRFGRKSAHGIGIAVSADTLGILPEPGGDSGRRPFYAVSIIRHNPPINEWRGQAHDYGLIEGQFWIAPQPVDIGEQAPAPTPDDPPPPATPEPVDLAPLVGMIVALAEAIARLEARDEVIGLTRAEVEAIVSSYVLKGELKSRFLGTMPFEGALIKK